MGTLLPRHRPRTAKQRTEDRLRKRRQRQREADSGYAGVQLSLLPELVVQLEIAALLHPRKSKEAVIVDSIEGHLERFAREASDLVALTAAYWPRIRPFAPYAHALGRPGGCFRVGSVTYTHDQWIPLAPIYSRMLTTLAKFGISGTDLAPGVFDQILPKASRYIAATKDLNRW